MKKQLLKTLLPIAGVACAATPVFALTSCGPTEHFSSVASVDFGSRDNEVWINDYQAEIWFQLRDYDAGYEYSITSSGEFDVVFEEDPSTEELYKRYLDNIVVDDQISESERNGYLVMTITIDDTEGSGPKFAFRRDTKFTLSGVKVECQDAEGHDLWSEEKDLIVVAK